MQDKNTIYIFLKRNWIAALGAVFFVIGLLFLLKVLFEEVNLSSELKVGASLAAGLMAFATGFYLINKQKPVAGEAMAGFGLAIFYGSLAWSIIGGIFQLPTIGLLMISGVFTIAVGYLSSQYQLRILASMGIFAGVSSVFLVKPSGESILPVGIYLLAVNAGSLWLYLKPLQSKQPIWHELKLLPFALTSLALFTAEFLSLENKYMYNPWEAWAFLFLFFTLYSFVFLKSIFYNKNKNSAMDMFLNIANAILFLVISISLCKKSACSNALPMIFTGVYLLFTGAIFYKTMPEKIVGNLHLMSGGALLALSAFSMESIVATPGLYHVVRVIVWIAVGGVALFLSKILKNSAAFIWAGVLFFFTLFYWYATAWDVQWFPIFEMRYIPFLNPGALAWFLLGFLGLMLAKYTNELSSEEGLRNYGFSKKVLQILFLFFSHIIFLGLLTLQSQNLWDAYEIEVSTGIKVTWVHSFLWIAYSLGLFVKGALSAEKFFSSFASVVIVLSTLKVLFYDLDGQSNLVRGIFFLLLGALMISVAVLLQRMFTKIEKEKG